MEMEGEIGSIYWTLCITGVMVSIILDQQFFSCLFCVVYDFK